MLILGDSKLDTGYWINMSYVSNHVAMYPCSLVALKHLSLQKTQQNEI
jgi:hypothetical protein